MLNFKDARQILPQVWHLPDFLLDIDSLRRSYRANQQPWRSEYPNRLLTPWGTNPKIESALAEAPKHIQQLTGRTVNTQVGYASLDLSGSRIMMHRLHSDIGAYIQVFTGEDPSPELCGMFCCDPDMNANHLQDYADISEFRPDQLVKIKYRPNDAWLMINEPRCFFGTAFTVAPNSVRETVCLHFASELPAST
jgi:hypothetical protein